MGKIERYIVYGVTVAVFIAVAFFDFNISQSLFSMQNGFGKLFEVVGDGLPFLFISFACWVLAFFHPKDNKTAHRVVMVLFILAAIGVSAFGGYHLYGSLVRNYAFSFGSKALIIIVLAVFFAGLSFLPVRFIKKERSQEAFLFAVFVVVLVVCTLAWAYILKFIWLRPRFRTLYALQEVGAPITLANGWKAFFEPQFFLSFSKYQVGGEYQLTATQIDNAMKILGITKWARDEFFAFPSSHVMTSLMMLPLCALPRLYPALDKKHTALGIRVGVYVYTIAMAFGRIVCGAHHASDVTAGFFFAFVIYDLGYVYLYERFLRGRYLVK